MNAGRRRHRHSFLQVQTPPLNNYSRRTSFNSSLPCRVLCGCPQGLVNSTKFYEGWDRRSCFLDPDHLKCIHLLLNNYNWFLYFFSKSMPPFWLFNFPSIRSGLFLSGPEGDRELGVGAERGKTFIRLSHCRVCRRFTQASVRPSPV